jgi:hypothetical protein
MSIIIEQSPNLSLQDIVAEHQRGTSVLRSAHVGNARGYNLALAELGIPFLLVDHTIVASQPGQLGDKNYLPGSIVTREAIQPLAACELGGLSLRTTAECPETGSTRYIDEIHTDTLAQAFPETSFVTNTEYVRTEELVANEVIRVAATTMPHLFTRQVTAEDHLITAEEDHNFAAQALSDSVLQLSDNPRVDKGVILPNEVDIVLNFVIEALKSDNDKQIHLGGPDMPGYVKKAEFQENISRLYSELLKRPFFRSRLPEILIVQLVPTHYAEFVTTGNRRALVTAVLDSFQPGENPTRQANCAAALENTPELLIDVRSAPYTSQYDLLAENGLWMPEVNTTLTMAQLRTLAKSLRKIKGQQICKT